MQIKPLLGVIGGMGPYATSGFYDILHGLQNVNVEQEYLDVLLFSMTSTPDRTSFITGKSNVSPLEHLIHAARTLESAGATFIAIPCVTSHFFYDSIAKSVGIPVINMLDETARIISASGKKRVYLLATDGTLKSEIFHAVFGRYGIEVMVPAEDVQSKVMAVIYDIKRGGEAPSKILDAIISDAFNRGTDAVVLGCTELCGIRNAALSCDNNNDIINTLGILAKASLQWTIKA